MNPLTCDACKFTARDRVHLAGHRRSYSHKIVDGETRMKALGWVPLPDFKYQWSAPSEEVLSRFTRGRGGKHSTFVMTHYVPMWVKAEVVSVVYGAQEKVIKKLMKNETARLSLDTFVRVDGFGTNVLEW